MNHLVITRLMIGVSRPSAFQLHSRVLLETTFPSMAAQTVQNFQWVVVTDELIDPASRTMIEERFAAHPNFHLATMDSFASGMRLDIAGLCEAYCGTTTDVLTTRIDDDDALRIDYLEQAQRAIGSIDAPVASFSQRRGVGVASAFKRHRPVVSKDGTGAGMTVFARDVRLHNAHSHNHRTVHRHVAEAGGIAVHADDEAPQYLIGVHPASDSRERQGIRAIRRIKRGYATSSRKDPVYRDLLASFGLPVDFDKRIATIRQDHVDAKPPIFSEVPGQARPFSRLGLKKQYFDMALPLREQLEGATGRNRGDIERQLHLIRQAFYLV